MIPVVLFGQTGCGKTNLLRELDQRGFPILDLEALARHRGSVFGQINIAEKQPSQSSFEESINSLLENFYDAGFLFLEHEAQNIGKLRLPDSINLLYEQGFSILVKTDPEKRVQYILGEYLPADKNELMVSLNNLKQRLDPAYFNQLYYLLETEQFSSFCGEILDYYDHAKQYHHQREYACIIEDKGPSANADELLNWVSQYHLI